MGHVFKLEGPINPTEEGNQGSRPLSSQNVIMLAKNFTPSTEQFQLLNRGLTFIPTIDINKNQKMQLELDIQTYHRKVKLATFFKNSEKSAPRPFTPLSIWTPPPEKLPEEVHVLIKKDIQEFKRHFRFYQEKPNLSENEVKALKDLIRCKHIVIKPADKGSSVVILDRDQYIMEVNRQLSNPTYYKKLQQPIYLQTIDEVNTILNTLKSKKFITAAQKQYLKGDTQPRERRFYILPKIHKDPTQWTVPYEVPPGRPIVSDCSSETYRTAEYVDYFLNPLSVKHASYVKDTYHFIDMVKNLQIPPNCCFFSLDVESLYTNIDTPAGLAAVKKMFDKYPDVKRPDDEVLQLLEINLTKNDFEFNGDYYLQVKGTAMGKRFAPAYANIFMANWEEEALAKCPKQPLHYLRYLDDIWGIWSYSKEEFIEFINILNDHDTSIKLKYEIHDQSIDFLDTTIYKGKSYNTHQRLDIKVFFKKTDTHALLFKSSFHPKHTFKGLVKAQLIRFHRICTQQSDFWEAVKILFGALKHRGYPRPFLRKCLKSFQIQSQKYQENIIPLITTFSSASTIVNRKIKDNFRTIMEDSGILRKHQVISAQRRHKNLKDFLVRAKLKKLDQVHTEKKPEYFSHLQYIRNQSNKKIFKISQHFAPQTTNCIYVIFCDMCGKQYIGETKNSMATRMWQHRYNITNKKETTTPLVRHFLFHGLQNLRMAGIQSNLLWTDTERKKMERRWIYWINTKEPFGLNVRYN